MTTFVQVSNFPRAAPTSVRECAADETRWAASYLPDYPDTVYVNLFGTEGYLATMRFDRAKGKLIKVGWRQRSTCDDGKLARALGTQPGIRREIERRLRELLPARKAESAAH